MQRLKLKIKKSDGSIYWTTYFSSMDALNAWVAEEQTRPYWDPTYVCEKYELDDQNNETLIVS